MRWALVWLTVAGLLTVQLGCDSGDSGGSSTVSSGVPAPPPPPAPPGPGMGEGVPTQPGAGPQQPGAPGTVPPGMGEGMEPGMPPGMGEGMEPGMPPGMGQPPGPGEGYPPGMGQPPGPGEGYPPGMGQMPGDQWMGEGMEPGMPPGPGQPPRPGEAYPPGMGRPPGPGEAYPPGTEPGLPPNSPEGRSMQNLKQIALAMQNYHKKGGRFPPAAYCASRQGQPLLSWRVLLLQFLGQEALYRQFRFNEAWDSPHNLALAARMPEVYKTPGGPADNKTCYLGAVGPGTIFSQQEGMPMSAIRDGTSNTMLVVEADADRAVVWTQPQDLRFIPAQPAAGLGTLRDGQFLAASADGAVHRVGSTLDNQVLRALFTAAGGEAVDLSRLDAGVGATAGQPGGKLLTEARRALTGGRQKQGVAYLLADAVVRADEEVLGKLRWSPGLKRPMLTTRWGVVIQTSLSPEMLGAAVGAAGAQFGGGQQPQGMPPGVERGFEGEGLPGGRPRRDGPGQGPGATAVGSPLQFWQSLVGQPMVERLQTRVSEGYFSDWFNQPPETPQARPGGNFPGQPGGPGMMEPGMEGMGPGMEGMGPGMEGMGPGMQGMGPGMEGMGPGMQGMGPGMEGMGPGMGPGMRPGMAKNSNLPGFAILGLATDPDEALEMAAKEEVDLLLLVNIRAKVGRSRGQKQTSLTLRILNAENGDELWTSKSLTDTRVLGAERTGRTAADPVGDLLDDLLEFVDENLRLVDMPSISAEVAKRRAAVLTGQQDDNPLPALMELRYYEWKELVTPEELSEYYAKIVGPEDGPRLATGTEPERQQIVQRWLPGR